MKYPITVNSNNELRIAHQAMMADLDEKNYARKKQELAKIQNMDWSRYETSYEVK